MFKGPQGSVRSRPASLRTPATAPQQVLLLLFSPGGGGSNASLILKWDDLSGLPGGGQGIEARYSLEVREGAAQFPDPAPLTVDGPGLSLYGLQLNTQYSFRVTATNAAGITGPASAVFSTVTPAAPPLAPTAAPSVQPAAGAGLLVSWAPAIGNLATGGLGLTGYRVYASLLPAGGWAPVLAAGPGDSSATVYNLSKGFYVFAVAAVNSAGESPPSPPSTPPRAPPLPLVVWPSVASMTYSPAGTAVALSWAAPQPADGVAALRVALSERDALYGGFDAGAPLPPAATSYTYAGLTNGARFYVKLLVQQPDVAGGAWLDPPPAAWAALETPDAARPTAAAAAASGPYGDQIAVTWTPPQPPPAAGPACVYRVFARDELGALSVAAVPCPATRYVFTGAAGRTYTAQVQAMVNGSGSALSVPAPPVSVPARPPGAPGAAVATAPGGCAGCLSVAWAAAADGGVPLVSYTLSYFKVGDGSPLTLTVDGGTVSALLTGLARGFQYYFQVRAANRAGPGPASAYSQQLVPATAPDVVTGLQAAGAGCLGAGSVLLTWTPPASGEAVPTLSYTLYAFFPGNDYDPGTPLPASTVDRYCATGLLGPGPPWRAQRRAVGWATRCRQWGGGWTGEGDGAMRGEGLLRCGSGEGHGLEPGERGRRAGAGG